MAYSKVILNGTTLMDVTSDTVTSGSMTSGTTAHKNDGTFITGNIASKSSSDLTASGATVTAPAGYYASNASKSVSSGSVTAPSSISGTSASITTGTNTLTLSKTVSVTPVVSAGYVSSGTATNSSVSLTASVTTKGATTYHPSTTVQTISSGQYLTGAQTISAVTLSNLSAGNIKSGVTIKVGDSSDDDCVAAVTGTYEGSGGGGASNIVTGTFTTPSTNGIDTLQTVSYTGSGYPIMAYFIVDGGLYNSDSSWYSLIQRYAVGMWSMNKQDFSTAPAYSGSSDNDKCNVNNIYKSSTSSAQSHGGMAGISVYTFTDEVFSQDASGTLNKVIRFPSATSFRYYTISTSAGGYGLAPSTTYRYWIVYSE